ncbi:tyrosine-protein phosphatase [Arthrobacter ramosus]|uniref:Tyrosine-protein phosphatase n=1 Tax=Arthrobacter ramosus TaxID=1672 RepID=A0ABV5Y0C8_ARTRM|nr:tyrosine-protein phosphatase [Arthrobacter ramosus]
MGGPRGKEDRTLKVDGLVNGRDLGGLRRVDGTVTPRGVFFRSENVDWITGNGWQQIHDAGIRTVVDLRQQGERNTDVRERPGWLTTIHVDLDGLENKEFWADYWDNGLVGTALYFKRNNAEPRLEELCRQHGTTTEGAFRDTLAKFDLKGLLDAAALTDEDREGVFTWRGATTTPPNREGIA